MAKTMEERWEALQRIKANAPGNTGILPSMAELKTADVRARARTFAWIARSLALAQDGRLSTASQIAEASGHREAATVLRAAVAAGTLDQLPELAAVSSAWVSSLRNSAFDAAAAAGMIRIPKLSRAGITTQISASVTGEASGKTVRAVNLNPADAPALKASVICVLTRELLEQADFPIETLNEELRGGVAVATDANFLAVLTAGAPTIAAVNTTPAADLISLFDLVPRGQTSRPFFVGGGGARDRISLLQAPVGDNDGPGPISSMAGSRVLNIGFATSDAIAADTLLLVDLNQVAYWDDGAVLARSEHAAIQMDDSPTGESDSPPTPTTLVSMFQTNSVAIRAERTIGVAKLAANAAATLTGIDWLA